MSQAITLPPLPFPDNALHPVISANTLGFHYGKHHKAYVDKTNELVAGTKMAGMPLDELVRAAEREKNQKLFNNAAQAWNHTFFWNCLKPAGGKPSGEIASRIDSDLGGYEKFSEAFAKTAVETFGSGWAWLVDRGGKLEIVSTSNAGTPITTDATPLLTLDVWEHAYYLDYQNRRPDFAKAVIEKLLNWEFAAQNLASSPRRKAA